MKRRWLPLLAVWCLLLAYGLYFSALSIQRHRAFLTHASDLGQIDQAIWNTLHGHLLEQTKATGVQNVRLSDHVEPIFIPLSLVFLIYDNVEALLIVQSFALALGALAVFWIARERLKMEWAAVGFAAIYLLFPALEAANLAEFHAVTLAPAPLLFAYYYGSKQAWGRFALFSLLALAVKEEIALLVLAMALWFAVQPLELSLRHLSADLRRLPFLIAVVAGVWFVFALFVIIPHFNTLGRSPYTCRYVVSEDCPQVARGLFLDARLGYLGQLLASVGWIALLDPISLLLGMPLIAANVLSNFPAQYSGTYHYSAPVAPYLVLAAIGGSARLMGWLRSRSLAPYLALAPVLLLALGYHLLAGYTPAGGAFSWPQISPRDELFARFAAEIPADAIVSTTASLNPHLSHRRVLYRYLTVEDAGYVLLDVTEAANPTDFAVVYHALVDEKTFGVVDAADGYVLLRRGAPARPLPDAFFSAFRSSSSEDGPQYRATIDFSDSLRFLGYDVLADQYGRGSVRMYWQRLKPLAKNYNLFLFYADDQGNPRADVTLPSTLLFWYPTSLWRPDETVVGQTVPLDLGPRVRLGLAVLDGNNFGDIDTRLPARVLAPATLRVFDNSTWVELGALRKSGNTYVKE